MTNSPIRPYICKFQKLNESGEYLIVPFITWVFNVKLYFIFKEQTYSFSLTGYDLYEISGRDQEQEVLSLVRGIYLAKSEAAAILLQVEFYFRNKELLTMLSNNSFECLKSESFVGNWVYERTKMLDGHRFTDRYEQAMSMLGDYIRENQEENQIHETHGKSTIGSPLTHH